VISAFPAMGEDFVSVQADFVRVTMALVEDPINSPARNHFSRLEQCGARTESHEAYLVARGTKYLRLRAKVMGCLPLAIQESPGPLRYEVQPGPACNVRFLRSGGMREKEYLVKAQPEPAVHPSDRFHTDLIPSPLHPARAGNHPGHIVVDRSIACSVPYVGCSGIVRELRGSSWKRGSDAFILISKKLRAARNSVYYGNPSHTCDGRCCCGRR
jgi:hypothetical protein